MASATDSPQPEPSAEDPGLPPVTPPSGKFIVQLFVVPGLIVALLVGLLLAVNYFVSGSRDPAYYLAKLDDDNPDIRWRAASDLSQVLPRDNTLAGDVDFGLELTRRLERSYETSQEAEADFAKKVGSLDPKEAQRQRLPLEPDRDYITMLIGCVKHLIVPVAVPLLQEIVTDDREMELVPRTKHRRQALLSLAGIGNNMSRFDQLAQPEKEAILAKLGEASKRDGVSSWAMQAREYLEQRMVGKQSVLGMDELLDAMTREEDPKLREIAAFTGRFWYGTAEENERIDAILVRLTQDDGRGEAEREKFDGPPLKPEQQAEEVLKQPGFIIQTNAVQSLASRGSDKTPVPLLRNLLDQDYLLKMIRVRQPDGTIVPNEGKVQMILFTTMRSVAKLHEKNPSLDLSSLRSVLQTLTQHAIPALQEEANQTLEKF